MNPILFADTSFFVALLNPDDTAHHQAVQWARRFNGDVITTEWVLAELGNFLAAPSLRGLFSQVSQRVASNPKWKVVHADHEVFHRGSALYMSRQDKAWSLIDCTSFVTMRDEKIHQALTTDHHFKQAGFETPLLQA